MEDIPKDLVFNWDQIAMKIVPGSTWIMEKKRTKHFKIALSNDKHLITAVFGCSMSGKFFPIQLIYKGTTSKCQCQLSKGLGYYMYRKPLVE